MIPQVHLKPTKNQSVPLVCIDKDHTSNPQTAQSLSKPYLKIFWGTLALRLLRTKLALK